ncbi:prolipoprotein diacylglyceryl transferase [Tranquillimonas alkanivorans]|uniref:Phosphatidylglycerol--prolipoprotein diacylglyceryl transferase n=1 Tax=Tranquillimonas alkanivorans TaxID=441119 RepID=A0A1I5V409_9RHOB|nr:prolipoprotein diacylglyceryl transferase [Tranquillimonas alkanivorans]SFQ02228.1 phosphatidylglycerol:prolipoprotein diacylglycerol transferase [Tranquillimonas alkanivorans]
MFSAAIPFPNLDPEIFSIHIGNFAFALRWYALAYIAGILLGWRLCVIALRDAELWSTGDPPLSRQQLDDLVTWVILGIVLGGRLGFVLFYQPGFYLQHPLEILKVWQGGMSFHGGFIGVALAVLVFCARHKVRLMNTADLLALATPPGLFFGRLANFINAELWGRPTDLPWGVVFPGDAARACAQIAAPCARHPSQIYEALLEGALLGGVLVYLAWRRGWFATSGAMTGAFLTGYGAARSLVELVRQPDAQFVAEGNPVGHALHFAGWGLTMGQILSLPMIAVGLGLIWRARHRGLSSPPRRDATARAAR